MEKNRNLMIILTLLGLLFSYEINAGEQKNHCYDDDANMEWEALIQKYPDDRQIHALHALRIGLCFKVDRGDITVDEATEIFENMKMALINRKEREKELEGFKKEGKKLECI